MINPFNEDGKQWNGPLLRCHRSNNLNHRLFKLV